VRATLPARRLVFSPPSVRCGRRRCPPLFRAVDDVELRAFSSSSFRWPQVAPPPRLRTPSTRREGPDAGDSFFFLLFGRRGERGMEASGSSSFFPGGDRRSGPLWDFALLLPGNRDKPCTLFRLFPLIAQGIGSRPFSPSGRKLSIIWTY